MRYEKYVNIGDYSISHTFEGEPAEIKQMIEAVDLNEKPKKVEKKSPPSLQKIGFAEAVGEQIKKQREG